MGLDIVQERADKTLRLAAARADEDPRAGLDMAEYGIFRGELIRIQPPPFLHRSAFVVRVHLRLPHFDYRGREGEGQ